MAFLFSRLLLLLLLGVDWAGDPYCGQSPLSRPVGSQEAFPFAMVYRQEITQAIDAGLDLPSPEIATVPLPRAETRAPESAQAPLPLSGCGLVYVFMSIRR